MYRYQVVIGNLVPWEGPWAEEGRVNTDIYVGIRKGNISEPIYDIKYTWYNQRCQPK